MSELVKYFASLDPQQMKEAVEAMSPEAKRDLINSICHAVNGMAQSIVENKEDLWLTGELEE